MKHTLVIPTRNRPDYIDVAVGQYLSTDREDIQCIVCDASDSPIEVKLKLAKFNSDNRLKIIDNSSAKNSSRTGMKYNWSHALDHVKSKWVTFIGDDDVLFPDVVEYISSLEKKIPNLQALRWATAAVPVPYNSDQKCKLPLGKSSILAKTKPHLKHNFSWDSPPKMPSKLTGLYHGAVTLDFLQKLKENRGAWFKYNYIDYEIGWIVSGYLDEAVYTSRMFSINGYSPKSNSWATRSLDSRRQRSRDWIHEGGEFDYFSDNGAEYLASGLDPDFFFTLPVAIYGTMLLVAKELGIPITQQANMNFAKTLIAKGQVQKSEADFSWYMRNAKVFLSVLLRRNVNLNAPYIKTDGETSYIGLEGETIYVDRGTLPENYNDLAKLIMGFLVPIKYLEI